jgi:hypothetical protein
MELQEIATSLARGIEALDAEPARPGANPRTGEVYLPGVKSMSEPDVVRALSDWWPSAVESETEKLLARVGVPYPGLQRTKCDLVFTSPAEDMPKWAIEIKNITLIGNNGKVNDFGVTKVLSPFLKDRSLFHDILRMREHPLARRHAVLGYAFNYSLSSCEEALRRHPGNEAEVLAMRDVVERNGGSLSVEDLLLDFTDGIFRIRSLALGPMVRAPFTAWAHPCGGEGVIFGWEVRRPLADGTYDPRHPW